MEKRLAKSVTDSKIAGVCGGLGEYFGVDPTIVRIIFVCMVFFIGTGLMAYIILALVMPKADEIPQQRAEPEKPAPTSHNQDITN